MRRTLEYITAQAYENLEILTSANCSLGDATEKIAREFSDVDARIQDYRKPKDIGINGNFGFLLRQAVGEYFMWVPDDDEWDSTFIKACLGLLDKDASLVCSQVLVHYRKRGLKINMPQPDIRDGM